MASYTQHDVSAKMNEIASANWLLSSRRQRMDACRTSVLTCTAITDMGFRPSTWIRPAYDHAFHLLT